MDSFKSFLTALGYSVPLSAAFYFILKIFITNVFAKDLEKYKADLQNESSAFKKKFESLHTERAEVIKNTYKKIVATQREFESLMKPWQWANEDPIPEKRKRAADAFNQLSLYFHENEIFFDEDLANRLNIFVTALEKTWNEFHRSQDADSNPSGHRDVDLWAKVWDYLQKELPKLKKEIESNFRAIIGI